MASPARAGVRPVRGLTLLELIAVVVIFSMLLGLSVTLFRTANRDLGLRATLNQLVSVLRQARDFARMETAPAWVVLDMNDAHEFHPLTAETVGFWHFESRQGSETPGAFGRNGKVSGVQEVPGRVGDAFRFKTSGSVDCGPVPIWSADQGLSVDFWIRRSFSRGRQTVCSIGREFEMWIEKDGKLHAKLGKLEVSMPEKDRGTIPMTLPSDVWVRVHYLYNGRKAMLFVNGIPVDTQAGSEDWAKGGSLVLGDKSKGFTGVLDEVRLALIAPRTRALLPRDVTFAFPAEWKEVWIRFDSDGSAFAAVRTQPMPKKFVWEQLGTVTIRMKSPTEEKSIFVPLSGLVNRNP